MHVSLSYPPPPPHSWHAVMVPTVSTLELFHCTCIWISLATWQLFMYEMAVPISQSPQRSRWGPVLAERCPAQWVTCITSMLVLFQGDVVHWLFMYTVDRQCIVHRRSLKLWAHSLICNGSSYICKLMDYKQFIHKGQDCYLCSRSKNQQGVP